MSIARIYTSQKSRKVWTCGKCGTVLPVGSTVLGFAVGFRSKEQKRCTRPECYPSLSERESSAVSAVYAAQESVDLDGCTTLDDFQEQIDAVVEACTEVASEYEDSEMFEINEDLQERAEILNSAAEELANWNDNLDEEPIEEDEFDEDGPFYDEAHATWVEAAREAADEALSNMELP